MPGANAFVRPVLYFAILAALFAAAAAKTVTISIDSVTVNFDAFQALMYWFRARSGTYWQMLTQIWI